jgi:hypothetical protein
MCIIHANVKLMWHEANHLKHAEDAFHGDNGWLSMDPTPLGTDDLDVFHVCKVFDAFAWFVKKSAC